MAEWLSRALVFVRSRGWAFVASGLIVAFAYSLCRRSINLTDEGYLLSQVVDLLAGKVLYRDMDAFVTPGIWFLLAGLFRLVEPSVLTSRILAFAGYLGTLFVCYRIITDLTARAWGWFTVGLLLVFSIWAFPAWTTAFYSPIAVLFALLALERLLKWRESQHQRDLLLAGFFLGFSILCKQNYGALAVAGSFVALAAFDVEDRKPIGVVLRGLYSNGLRLVAGACAVALPTIAYFAYYGALGDAFDLLVLHPLVFMNHQDIAYPSLSLLWAATPLKNIDSFTYGAYFLSQAPDPFYSTNPILMGIHKTHLLARLHIVLFWLPVPGLALAGFLALRPAASRRPIDGKLVAVLAMAGFVFLGVFPRADFNHLINVYQPVIVALVLVLHRVMDGSARHRSAGARTGIALGCTLLFMYAAIAGYWYIHTLNAMNKPVSPPRGGVLVKSIDKARIEFQVRAIREMTRDGEAVLTIPALAMFNFLAERPVPGRYYNLYEHHIAHDGGRGVVEAAETHSVNLVVTDFNNFFSDRVGLRAYAPDLTSYLGTHFEAKFDIDIAGDRFHYLTRRQTPIEVIQSVDLIDSCDFGATSATYSREHLLFASLYHHRRKEHPAAMIETPCTIVVPTNGLLAVSIGYLKPIAVQRNATVTAEIWLKEGEQTELLLSEVIRLKKQDGWKSPLAPEYRIDLAKFSGREVTLVFRTQFRGGARMGSDIVGLALFWENPRIETPRASALDQG